MPLEKPTIPVSFPGSIRKSDLLKRCILRSGRRCCLPFLLLEEALPLHDESGGGSNGGGESRYDEGYRPGVHSELEGEAVGAGVAELIGNDHLVASLVLELLSEPSFLFVIHQSLSIKHAGALFPVSLAVHVVGVLPASVPLSM